MTVNARQKQEIARRRAQVAALLDKRYGVSVIAAKLGVHRNTVTDDARAIRADWRKDHSDAYKTIVERECRQLDKDERKWREKLEKKRGRKALSLSAQIAIYDTIHKIMVRRAKLVGTDAPERKQVLGDPDDAIGKAIGAAIANDPKAAKAATDLISSISLPKPAVKKKATRKAKKPKRG